MTTMGDGMIIYKGKWKPFFIEDGISVKGKLTLSSHGVEKEGETQL